jgi:hypothetical protein
MSEERPYLRVPMPSPNDWHSYREWVKRENEKADNDKDEERVVVIDLI